MSEKRFILSEIYSNTIMDTENCINNGSHCRMYDIEEVVDLLNEQQSTIDKQELRLQRLEELLELSENLNKSYREKLIDMNLKMVRMYE